MPESQCLKISVTLHFLLLENFFVSRLLNGLQMNVKSRHHLLLPRLYFFFLSQWYQNLIYLFILSICLSLKPFMIFFSFQSIARNSFFYSMFFFFFILTNIPPRRHNDILHPEKPLIFNSNLPFFSWKVNLILIIWGQQGILGKTQLTFRIDWRQHWSKSLYFSDLQFYYL